jgi:hypothetical protein
MVQITTTNSLTTWFLILLYTILVIREIASQPKTHGASSARLHACLLSSASSAKRAPSGFDPGFFPHWCGLVAASYDAEEEALLSTRSPNRTALLLCFNLQYFA